MKLPAIARQMAVLRMELGRVSHRLDAYGRGAKAVPIATLAPEPYELSRRLAFVLESSDDEYTASFVEANLATVGETEFDAVDALKSLMLDVYETLERTPNLGPAPARKLAVLRSFLTPTSRADGANNEGSGGADRP
ncbi:MAG TPA: hypothetical protein VGN57_02295 [Pirellulaceae bacterium]|jgi:hypothetical protein|nr:hypothetical protein [Pirellulaceae bacterium]